MYSQACVSPAEINELPEQVLRDRALALMAHKDSANLPAFPALAGVVTNRLLERVTSIIWSLSSDELSHWSKQRALARVIASIAGAKLPEKADAERPGNRMFEFVGRYRMRRKQLLSAEKQAKYRAEKAGRQPQTSAPEQRTLLEEGVYHCKFGCTLEVLPVRRVPPGLRAQPVEYQLSSIAEENLQLCRDNAYLRNLETEAIGMLERKLDQSKTDLSSSVATEYKALASLDGQRVQTREALREVSNLTSTVKTIQSERKDAQQALKQKEREMSVLGGKVARAHMDLAEAQRSCEVKKRKLQDLCDKERQSHHDLVLHLEMSNMSLRDECLKREAEAKAREVMCLRLGTHVTRLNMDIAELHREFDKSKAALEKQRCRAEAQLETEMNKTERLRVLKNQMARKKRAAEGRAQTTSKWMERAHTAEETLQDLQVDFDQLQEEAETRAGREASQDSRELFAVSGDNGRYGAYSWSLRLLIYKWLMRRTPPSAIAANIVDAVQLLSPGTPLRVPCTRLIRLMRQEATLVGEAISAFRIATAKRVVSFGFDETTKMGDGLASVNLQIETAEGEICDEVLRAAFLIPGGCADQVARAMELKVFARARRLLEGWQKVHEARFGVWPGPKPSQLGYHRLVQSLIMSDTCNAARAAKRMIIDMAAGAAEERAKEAGTWEAMDDAERKMTTTCYVGDCMQHIRNILIDAMAAAAATLLKDELKDSLEAFSAYERMSTDPMQLIRAVRNAQVKCSAVFDVCLCQHMCVGI